MSLYPPPTANVPVFNPALFTDVNGGVSYGSVGVGSFVNYPTAQGAVTWTDGTSTATLDNGSITLSVINGTTLQGVGLNGDGIAYNDGATIQGATWENLVTKVKAIGAITATSDPAVPPTQPKILNINDTVQIQNGETSTLPHTFVSLSADANLLRMNLCQDGTTNSYGTAGQVLKSGGSAGSMYWGSGGGGSGTLQDVLTEGNTATTSILLTDESFIAPAKVRLSNVSGGYSEMSSSNIYIGNNDASVYMLLSNEALLFYPNGLGVASTGTSLDITTPVLTFSALGGSENQVLTQNADGQAVWATPAGGGLQSTLLSGNTANVQGTVSGDPNYLPLGLGVIGEANGGSYLSSNIQTDGNLSTTETRCFAGLFSGSYITNGNGANIGVGDYGSYGSGFFTLANTDDATGAYKNTFTADFKRGFGYDQPATDGQSMSLKLKLKLVDVNGKETDYDQNSATIRSNNVDNTGVNSISLDATTPQTYILNNDGSGNKMTSISTAHSTTFTFTDSTPVEYDKFKVDTGTTIHTATTMALKGDFYDPTDPTNPYSIIDLYTGNGVDEAITGITLLSNTLNTTTQSEFKAVVITDDNYYLQSSTRTQNNPGVSRDNPTGALTYTLYQNRIIDIDGGVIINESQVTNAGFTTYTPDAGDPTNPQAFFNTFKIATDPSTKQTFLGASDQSGNYFEFTGNNSLEITAPSVSFTGNNTVVIDTKSYGDYPNIQLMGPTSSWAISNAGLDSGDSFTPQVFNFGNNANNGYTWLYSAPTNVGQMLSIDVEGYVVRSDVKTFTNNTGTLPDFSSVVGIVFPQSFSYPPTLVFNAFKADGTLVTETLLTLTTSGATITQTVGTDNISWTATGK